MVSQVQPSSNVFQLQFKTVTRLNLQDNMPCNMSSSAFPGMFKFWFHFHSVCQEYYLDGGMRRMLEKDEKRVTLAMGLTAPAVSAQPYSTIPR